MASAPLPTPPSEHPLRDLCDAAQAVADGRSSTSTLLQDFLAAAHTPDIPHVYIRPFTTHPPPGAPTATTFTACAKLSPRRNRSTCWRTRGGKVASAIVAKVFSRGNPLSRRSRSTRRWLRCSCSRRTSS